MTNKIANEGPTLDEITVVGKEGVEVVVRKLTDDPMCLRISAGGNESDGYYFVFRGEAERIKEALTAVVHAFDHYTEAKKAMSEMMKKGES